MGEKNERIVKCFSCGEPVHIDELGGLFTIPGYKGHFIIHKRDSCLRKWVQIEKELKDKKKVEVG